MRVCESYQMHNKSLIEQRVTKKLQTLVVGDVFPYECLRRMNECRPQ